MDIGHEMAGWMLTTANAPAYRHLPVGFAPVCD